ncbi:hypothetical protein QUB63_34515 [Microcoleus sp. ARI1-B5]|uniref:hypothetical protein n=1 Tax=unclassified Microcoleus TaxID=2642155 RepID=UPI002FD580BD
MDSQTLFSQDAKLKAALLQRGENSSKVGLRDLKRYYALLNHQLLEFSLTAAEASLVCEALKDYQLKDDPEQARTICQQVVRAVQQYHLEQKRSVNETFICKLEAQSDLQAVALIDAVERYWERTQTNPNESLETKLLKVDLIKCCDFAL